MGDGKLVHVTLLFFAKARELVGESSRDISVPSQLNGKRLKMEVLNAFPTLIPLANSLMLALNQEYIENNEIDFDLKDGDEIALIPPISGG